MSRKNGWVPSTQYISTLSTILQCLRHNASRPSTQSQSFFCTNLCALDTMPQCPYHNTPVPSRKYPKTLDTILQYPRHNSSVPPTQCPIIHDKCPQRRAIVPSTQCLSIFNTMTQFYQHNTRHNTSVSSAQYDNALHAIRKCPQQIPTGLETIPQCPGYKASVPSAQALQFSSTLPQCPRQRLSSLSTILQFFSTQYLSAPHKIPQCFPHNTSAQYNSSLNDMLQCPQQNTQCPQHNAPVPSTIPQRPDAMPQCPSHSTLVPSAH